ncbi:hypothetical protein [Streptomyces nitrosporeus]|uniref:hypothetical protein n=1 Tax=Streptomyces nitrosporeus TaxID=28894 RepID=UPI00167C60C8|nr:hypothetical protein [Streptomyces nitrosporeus]GGZ19780.1 hypothetical protein GCM10010327_58710 [Streptomyces nitrosporeus]
MSSLRIMDSDPGKAKRTADAVQRALEAPAAPGNDDQEVTVERTDRPRQRSRRALPRGDRRRAGA